MKYLTNLTNLIDKNLPGILTLGSIVGVGSTAVLSYQASEELHQIENPTIKDYVKHLTPPVIAGSSTVGCILGLNYAHARKYAALASMYAMSQIDLKTYKEKVKELFGQEKANEVEKEVHKEKKKFDSVYIEKDHNQLICDTVTGRIFKKTPMDVMKAANTTNQIILRGGKATINDFYELLGIDDCEIGNRAGWKIDGGTDSLEIEWDTMMDGDFKPMLTIRYDISIIYGWD